MDLPVEPAEAGGELDVAGVDGVVRARRILYGVTTAALSLLIGLAVLDGLDVVDAYGVDTSQVRTSGTLDGDQVELDVRYTTVSRPALASPFRIVVTKAGGFDAPIRIAVDRDYLLLWDANALVPAPSAETTQGDDVVWEFDPPTGDTLTVSFDARIEPAAQSGRDGAVAVLDDDDRAVAGVEFHTRVLP